MTPVRLDSVVAFLSELDRRGVRYAHWKSNEHLEDALRGETDLDLLVDPGERDLFESVVREFGFARMTLPRAKTFPGRDGFLGFDPTSGSLAQLDVHYRLVLGEQLVKNHHLPIEEWLLEDTRVLHGVRVPDAARETIVFYLRVSFKSTLRQRLYAALGRAEFPPANIRREARWLASSVQPQDLSSAMEGLDLPVSEEEVLDFHRRIVTDALDWRFVGRAKRSLMRRLRRYQRRPTVVAWMLKGALRVRSSRPGRRLGLGIPPKRLTTRAPFIAVVGADGSGKSRLTTDLAKWLRWKLSVRHLYLGQPKSGFVFKLLNKPGSLLRNMEEAKRGSADGLERLAAVTDALKWVYLANKRKRLVAEGLRAADRGEVVIAERFPLPEFWAMPVPMDGPRLGGSGSPLEPWEARQYAAIPRPDLILVLAADLATLRERKDDLPIDDHRSKADAVLAIEPGPGVHVIDATQPYPEVLLEAKRRIWEEIVATR